MDHQGIGGGYTFPEIRGSNCSAGPQCSKWVLGRSRLPAGVIPLTQCPREGSCGPFKVVGVGLWWGCCGG